MVRKEKDELNSYVCFKLNLSKVLHNTWWIDFGCTTHVSNTMQGFLTIQTISLNEKFVFRAPLEAVETYRLKLNTRRHLDLLETLFVPSLSRNLVSLYKLNVTRYCFNSTS